MNIYKYAIPVVKNLWIQGILEEFHYDRDVYKGSENLIQGLKVFAFFHLILFRFVETNHHDRTCRITLMLVCTLETSGV